MEESPHQINVVFHAKKSANICRVCINSNRLLTKEKLLRLKAKRKKQYNLLRSKKVKSKYKSCSRGQLKEDILAEKS